MDIKIKKKSEIEKMKVAANLAREALLMIGDWIKEGVSTKELNEICHKYITKNQKAIPAPLNYNGFPASICTSINDVVCHGVPSSKDILKAGDIINIDITVIKDGYYGDTSKMFQVGNISYEDQHLCKITQQALYEGIKMVYPGSYFGSIGTAINKYIKKQNQLNRNYSIVKNYCGHGIGVEFHEEPQILHYKNGNSQIMKEGMCFTIEPMINLGKACGTKLDQDDWTVRTTSGQNSAQYEHTILVSNNGCEILTIRDNEVIL